MRSEERVQLDIAKGQEQRWQGLITTNPRVPNLFLTMDPFSISTDEHVSLKFLMTKKLSKITKIH